jgi:hypothetical protein
MEVADRLLLERSLGFGLTDVVEMSGGFSRSHCWSVGLDTGRRVFVKAAHDEDTTAGNRNEAIVLTSVSSAHLPAFIGIFDDGRFLVTEDLGTADWSTPLQSGELFAAIAEIGALTGPLQLRQSFQGAGRDTWHGVLIDGRFAPTVGVKREWIDRHGHVLCDASSRADTSGGQLLHGDLAPGNWCLDSVGVWRFVDWASAYRGNPIVDEAIASIRLTRLADVAVSSSNLDEHPEFAAFVGGRFASEVLDIDWTVTSPKARVDRIQDIRASLVLCAHLLELPPPFESLKELP